MNESRRTFLGQLIKTAAVFIAGPTVAKAFPAECVLTVPELAVVATKHQPAIPLEKIRHLQVFVNGLLLRPEDDYKVDHRAGQIEMNWWAAPGDRVAFVFQTADGHLHERWAECTELQESGFMRFTGQ